MLSIGKEKVTNDLLVTQNDGQVEIVEKLRAPALYEFMSIEELDSLISHTKALDKKDIKRRSLKKLYTLRHKLARLHAEQEFVKYAVNKQLDALEANEITKLKVLTYTELSKCQNIVSEPTCRRLLQGEGVFFFYKGNRFNLDDLVCRSKKLFFQKQMFAYLQKNNWKKSVREIKEYLALHWDCRLSARTLAYYREDLIAIKNLSN